jgi:hypothetical protein
MLHDDCQRAPFIGMKEIGPEPERCEIGLAQIAAEASGWAGREFAAGRTAQAVSDPRTSQEISTKMPSLSAAWRI